MKSYPTLVSALFLSLWVVVSSAEDKPAARPNILFAISDDQSFPHASAYGAEWVETPAFDQVAASGVLFTNAFAASPGCSPSRAAILTGRYPWMIEGAGTHASDFPTKFVAFPDLLEKAGYFIGATGKTWGPGNWKVSGRERNPAGPSFDKQKLKNPPEGISNKDYAANFADFLAERPDESPFFFWYGATEPHRDFKRGIGLEHGKALADAEVPAFLPDTDEIRSDLLDYAFEIEWFDKHLGRMLEQLEAAGELDNTLVIVTSDNGMAFPRAKANVYEYGIHMPLAISWPKGFSGGRTAEQIVNLIDICPTLLEAAGVAVPELEHPIVARSLMPLLADDGDAGDWENVTFSGRERHSSSRWNNNTYPQRAIRTDKHLLIHNFRPERWPAGAPQKMGDGNYPKDESRPGPMHAGYHDIDACPSLDFLIEHRDDAGIAPFFHLSVDRRPEFELYDIQKDPACLKNLAESQENIPVELSTQLESYLRETGDPRVVDEDGGEVWERYQRFSKIRSFPKPDWAE